MTTTAIIEQSSSPRTAPSVSAYMRSQLGLSALWYVLSLLGSLLVVQTVIGLSGQIALIESYGAHMVVALAVVMGLYGFARSWVRNRLLDQYRHQLRRYYIPRQKRPSDVLNDVGRVVEMLDIQLIVPARCVSGVIYIGGLLWLSAVGFALSVLVLLAMTPLFVFFRRRYFRELRRRRRSRNRFTQAVSEPRPQHALLAADVGLQRSYIQWRHNGQAYLIRSLALVLTAMPYWWVGEAPGLDVLVLHVLLLRLIENLAVVAGYFQEARLAARVLASR